ncbi:putative potassium channel [Talaromyces proteolyticus]|uniref:Potassium channel n=1 Tax=Talaromyces proteolyticus TaxID=1131652 RepID=A0AAD4KX02_9EURO|nr:putative potassium channel [Talaromyces proteolyticus]KAH8701866.1 putative potassium channel [Talaromyces proteolyticus]
MLTKNELTKYNHWWLTWACFPVIAGTLCAMAVMFNICAVAQGWLEIVEVDGSTSTVPPSVWFIALKAVSLTLASITYIGFILTMTSKHNPTKGFIATISGWLVAATVLFSLIGVMVRQHRIIQPPQSLQYTQNFFYGILAAGLYILIAIFLAIYTSSTHSIHLTREERRKIECTSIILRSITFAIFLIGGAGTYSAVESWSFTDSLYFTDYTLLTIGIGNFAPRTHLGRSLLFPYATAGIIILGLLIRSITSFAKGLRDMKLRLRLEEERGNFHERRDFGGSIDQTHENIKQSSHVIDSAQFPGTSEITNLHRVKSDFYRRYRWKALLLFLTSWFVLWLVSAVIFRRSEKSQNWSYSTALYFTYISLTTIGYGDLYPTSNFGKAFFVFWSLIAIPVLTNLVTAMGDISLRAIVDFLSYMWKFGALGVGHILRRNRHTSNSRASGKRNINDVPNPESLASGTELENYACSSSAGCQSTKYFQPIGITGSSATNEIELGNVKSETSQNKVLLVEEIMKMVAALRNGSVEYDPSDNWTRILPLLHAGEAKGPDSAQVTRPAVFQAPEKDTTRRAMSSERVLADKNAELLWMLQFMVEKLYLDLREEELYRKVE